MGVDWAARRSVIRTGSTSNSTPVDPAARAYSERAGDACALSLWSRSHRVSAFIAAEALLLVALHGKLVLVTALILGLSLCLVMLVFFRFAVVLLSLLKNSELRVPADGLDGSTGALPIYTVLVPLYREEKVAHSIVHALARLRYPRERLDVKLILEADDELTAGVVRDLELGQEYEIVIVPPTHPRTKPKACNHGFARALGEYAVIYDAEDRPDPDQLLKVVHAFQRLPAEVACLQAKLNFYNPRENFLTRSFAIEYSAWFDMILPGLQRLGAPIPLGGTSNHFRAPVLRALGAWDPFNVTEDCDLGVRLAIQGYRTMVIDSTTWEEANNALGNWVRQRSRWAKGYLQTHLVHTKHPLLLIRRIGLRNSAYFVLSVGGAAAMQLINLVLWPITLLYLALLAVDVAQGREVWGVIAGSRDEYRVAWQMLFLETGEDYLWSRVSLLGFCASVGMAAANALFIGINLLACRRRNYGDLWLTALCSPLYWILGSVASWRGLVQLIARPHFWEKTMHGLSRSPTEDAR